MQLSKCDVIAPCRGIQEVQDSGFHARGFLIPGTGFQSLPVEFGFQIPIVNWIPDSTSKNFPESGFPDMGRDLHLCAPSALRACPSGTYGDLLKSPLQYPRGKCLTNLDLYKLADVQRGGHHKCFSARLFKITATIKRNGIP